jgi:hypothetical protein
LNAKGKAADLLKEQEKPIDDVTKGVKNDG